MQGLQSPETDMITETDCYEQKLNKLTVVQRYADWMMLSCNGKVEVNAN